MLSPFTIAPTRADGNDRPEGYDQAEQLNRHAADDQLNGHDQLDGHSTTALWESPVLSRDSRFRSRARMAVSGSAMAPVLGLPGESASADLSDCPLHPEPVEPVLAAVKALIRRAQVAPYDVARRRGDLKNVLVTVSQTGAMMLQLVLRSEKPLDRIREHLPALLTAHPEVTTVTANIHPDHTALLTGDREIHLAGAESLAMPTGDVVLHARPGSFVQTNTAAAGELYRTVARWVLETVEQGPGTSAAVTSPTSATANAPLRIWDLYCGLGGFALHIVSALAGRDLSRPVEITGVEVSAEAIDGARESAAMLTRHAAPVTLTFLTDDATAWAQRTAEQDGAPDLLVVNPPRRGIGPELADWVDASGIRRLVYSSCNPASLVRDLQRMPSLRIVRARYVDMFPHTEHAEVVVMLERRDPSQEQR